MVRLADARIIGTCYVTCVLHIAPESAVGGPLALVKTGDVISLDVAGRRLELLMEEEPAHPPGSMDRAAPAVSSRQWPAAAR